MDKENINSVEHAGVLLNEEFIIPMKLTLKRIAKAIDVDASRISEIITGKVRMSANMDYRFTKFFGLSQGYFLRIQQIYDINLARINAEKSGVKIKSYLDDNSFALMSYKQ